MGKQANRIAILASCTGSKRFATPSNLRLDDVPAGSLLDRAAEWRERVDRTDADRVPAVELYAGQHWKSILAARDDASELGLTADIWIASAGFGLLKASDHVPSYSATFASGQRDSILQSVDDRADPATARASWWDAITSRSLRDVMLADEYDAVLVAASGAYVDAIEHELKDLAGQRNVILVSAGARASLSESSLDVTAEMAPSLGGALVSLNARALGYVIKTSRDHGFDRAAAQGSLDRLRVPKRAVARRVPMADAELLREIGKLITDDPSVSRTKALRRLRDQAGIACEQKRFAQLFEVASTSDAG